MFEANEALLALDSLQPGDNAEDISLIVRDAAFVHSELVALQDSQLLSAPESAQLQTAMGRLHAKLHFFGRIV
jgi:hypothetical protein